MSYIYNYVTKISICSCSPKQFDVHIKHIEYSKIIIYLFDMFFILFSIK